MKLILRFEVDVDEDGLAAYYEMYPGFLEEEETPADTLIREAIANWEHEGLTKNSEGNEVIREAIS